MILKTIYFLLILNLFNSKILPQKTLLKKRILSEFEDYENSKSVNSMRMLMTDVKRDAEIKNFQQHLTDIETTVGQITETAMSKLTEMNDLIQRKKM